jgi:hypothetical protein
MFNFTIKRITGPEPLGRRWQQGFRIRNQAILNEDADNTRSGSSAVSMTTPLMKEPKAIDDHALAEQYALINDALRTQVQRMTRENRDLTVAGIEKDTKIEELRQTVENLLIEKNRREIELECAYDNLYDLVGAITSPTTHWRYTGYDDDTQAEYDDDTQAEYDDDTQAEYVDDDLTDPGPAEHIASTFCSDMLDQEAEKMADGPLHFRPSYDAMEYRRPKPFWAR